MAQPTTPARIGWNNFNLNPNEEKFPSYRLYIEYIYYVNNELTFGIINNEQK
jgi:hypothetical protein